MTGASTTQRPWRPRLRRGLTILATLLLVIIAVEQWLEIREERTMAAGETFAQVGPARIRYSLRRGKGPAVVFLTGMAATLEQFHYAQNAITPFATSLAYDRGGIGFTRGSSAFDGEQQSDELAALLRTLAVPEPVVIVGYSSSAALARVFVGRHRQRVGAMVLLDPYLAELEQRTDSPWKASVYAGWLVPETFRALVGFRRAFPWDDSEDQSVEHQKAMAAQRSLKHWIAIDREWLATARTNRQAAAADHALTDLPLIVLVGDISDLGDVARVHNDVVREFVARSRHGSIRQLVAGDHSDMVWRGPNFEALIAAIREAVGNMTRGVPTPPPERSTPDDPR